jgi:dUTP pyrophosphatase
MCNVEIKIRNESENPLPSYATEGSAGMDIRAWVAQEITLEPLQRILVPTGLYIELPEGYEAQIRPRSGMAVKQGITCLNTPGTIDSDYRGEIKILLVNLSDSTQVVYKGDRIAQMVIQKVERAIFRQVNELNSTSRGSGGFGSTGKE